MPHRKLGARSPYITRDESWMYFNRRLLFEAERECLPLLERFNYLGIYSNNLDEFFRVRIASLRRVADASLGFPEQERRQAISTLVKIARLNREYSAQFEQIFHDLLYLLDKEHIHIVNEQQLTTEQEGQVRRYYIEHISGATNPIFLSSTSFISDLHLKESLYHIILLKHGDSTDLALLEIPTKECGRFVRLPDSAGESYLMFLDDVLRFCLPYIFAGMQYEAYEAYTFKFTKDSEIEMDTDLRRSVIEKVSQGIKRRKRGEPIRLVYDNAMPDVALNKICEVAEFGTSDTRIGGGRYHNMRDLMKLPCCGRTNLYFKPQPPLYTAGLEYSSSILEQVLHRDIGIHFPYESFDHFLRVLREAAINRDVTDIHISLYRVAQNSKVVKALMAAAQNGKRVTAVVELLARFDEESNISWSKKMQDSGIHVVFGHEKLKIHSKLALITMKQGRIACVGSGNMHEGTAKLYTDYMLLTSHRGITADVLKVFDFIERPFLNVAFKELLVAPNDMRKRLYNLINREIRYAEQGKLAYIKLKLNHIVDERMVSKLYEASEAGVRIDLCLRGNCSLIPGIPGYSTNITINGIIDRYLEHSRIYIFGGGGRPRYYIGSTDWMTRNLDKRIEVMAPVYDPDIQRELEMIVDYGIADTAQGYYVNTMEGVAKRDHLSSEGLFRSQEALYDYYLSKQDD